MEGCALAYGAGCGGRARHRIGLGVVWHAVDPRDGVVLLEQAGAAVLPGVLRDEAVAAVQHCSVACETAAPAGDAAAGGLKLRGKRKWRIGDGEGGESLKERNKKRVVQVRVCR